jgi:poly-gamma-glutamate synthesis protein (capsule biosynthesis protein)
MLTFKNGKNDFGRKSTKETVEILFAGDFCPTTPESQKLIHDGKSGDMLSGVKDFLDDCDLSVIQFETPLTDKGAPIPKSGPNLKSPPDCVDFIRKAGFDVALLGNNHIGDVGTKPVVETIDILNRNGIKTVGAGKDIEAAAQALSIRKNGIKIAIMNVAENEFGGADVNKPGANPLNVPRNISQIIELSRKFDLVIVTVHGGNETNPFPTPRMVDTYRAFADAGAAAVISAHTHCPEGIEIWHGKPIIYSLGNFYFPYPGKKYNPGDFWWKGYMLKLKFDKKKAYSLEIIPTTFGPDESRILPFPKKARDQFFTYMSEISKVFEDRQEIRRIFDAYSAQNAYARIGAIKTHYLSDWPADNDPQKVKALLADPKKFKLLLVLRNLLNCETHHEMLSNLFRLLEDGKLESSGKQIQKYVKYRNADFGF